MSIAEERRTKSCLSDGEREKKKRKKERWEFSRDFYAGIGNCQVVEIACERRSRDGDAREGIRMCTRAFIYFA